VSKQSRIDYRWNGNLENIDSVAFEIRVVSVKVAITAYEQRK
jgi:hypothetical protein